MRTFYFILLGALSLGLEQPWTPYGTTGGIPHILWAKCHAGLRKIGFFSINQGDQQGK
jgi:hypothetical protein